MKYIDVNLPDLAMCQIEWIATEILNLPKDSGPGDFLKMLMLTYKLADPQNRYILLQSMFEIIEKYSLEEYLLYEYGINRGRPPTVEELA